MRHIQLPISGIEHAFRARVCDSCAHRTPVDGPHNHRACQDNCGQFQSIVPLYQAAAGLDPMIADVPTALKHLMPVAHGPINWPPARRAKVIRLIQQFLAT